MANHAKDCKKNIETGANFGEGDNVGASSWSYLDIREDAREYENRIFEGDRETVTFTSDNDEDEGEEYLGENIDKKPHSDRDPGSVKIC